MWLRNGEICYAFVLALLLHIGTFRSRLCLPQGRESNLGRELCHDYDTKPVFAAETDIIDEYAFVDSTQVIENKMCPKSPAYRLARYFAI
jgi:hypothetical protein